MERFGENEIEIEKGVEKRSLELKSKLKTESRGEEMNRWGVPGGTEVEVEV